MQITQDKVEKALETKGFSGICWVHTQRFWCDQNGATCPLCKNQHDSNKYFAGNVNKYDLKKLKELCKEIQVSQIVAYQKNQDGTED